MRLPMRLTLKGLPDHLMNEDVVAYFLTIADPNTLDQDDVKVALQFISPTVVTLLASRHEMAFEEHRIIRELNAWPADLQLLAVENSQELIKYLSNPTEEIKRAAVEKCWSKLRYITPPYSDDLVEVAMRQSVAALQYIPEPTEAMQEMALAKDFTAIRWIKSPSSKMMESAVEQNFRAVEYMFDPPRDLIDRVMKENPGLFGHSRLTPPVVNAESIDLYESCIGHSRNASVLYAKSDGYVTSNYGYWRADVPTDRLLDPDSRQMECLARVLGAIGDLQPRDGIPLFRDFIVPTVQQVPMGKQYCENWQQADAQGRDLVDWLGHLTQAVSMLSKRVSLPKTHQQKVDRFLDKAGQQIEMAIGYRMRQSEPGTERKRDDQALDGAVL